jgi:dihydroflavonol-4-reductase
MRALVTGAGGFIGHHVVRALAAAGATVIAFDRAFPETIAQRIAPAAELRTGDILDPSALRSALAGCDAVFHLAAVYSYARADAAAMEAINVRGTEAVLNAVADAAPGCRVVHTSTCATCGPVRGRSATERDLPPDSELAIPYKRTKLGAERVALEAAGRGLDVVVVNPTVPVGPGDLRPTPTGKMIEDVASGRARGYLARSVLNVAAVEDVAAGHLLALEHGRRGERYLLGGENLSIREVFAAVATAVGRPEPRIGVPWAAAYGLARIAHAGLAPLGREPKMLILDEVRSGRLPHLFDDGKARAELGYTSRPAAEALAEAARSAVTATLPPTSISTP